MVPGDLRDPFVTELVFTRCVLAVIRLQQADEVGGKIVPETSWLGLMGQIIMQRFLAAITARHRQGSGQNIVERWDIGRNLKRFMTPPREGSPPRPARIAQQ